MANFVGSSVELSVVAVWLRTMSRFPAGHCFRRVLVQRYWNLEKEKKNEERFLGIVEAHLLRTGKKRLLRLFGWC
jgi:hypothetical protein